MRLALIAFIFSTIVCAVGWAKNKLSAMVVAAFCIKYFREPTDAELKECSDYAVRHFMADLIGKELSD